MKLTTAGALVRFLKNQYVARDGKEHRLVHGVFGIFGHGNVAGLGQALEEHGGRDLPFYQPKNEQAMVHTATAFAKARRRLGTFACTTSVGPGATNLLTGAATATINRLPVLLLPGDIFASRIPNPVLQQLEHPLSPEISVNDCFRPVSRFWDRINRPEQILHSLPEAMRVLADPANTGAVTICLPQDVQAEAWDYPEEFFSKRVFPIHRHAPAPDALKEAVALIRASKRPMIIAGGGAHYSESESALETFASSTGIPVAMTQAGKGSLLEDHRLCLGAVGATGTLCANEIATNADLILCIGTRLSDFTTASKTQFRNPKVRFIGLNVSESDAHKLSGLALVADAREALAQLTSGLAGYHVDPSYGGEVAQLKERWEATWREITASPAKPGSALRQAEVIRILNEQAGPGATVVHAAGGLPGDLHKLWRCQDSQDYHSEYGYSCMGYEIAGALGVKLAQPDREVYAFLGDGSYLMLNHEIVTSVQENRKITIVLNDNGGYQCIHGLQRSCGSSSFGNEFRMRDRESLRLEGDLVRVDFPANAKSLGATVFEARTAKELESALVQAKKESGTCLVYVPVDPSGSVPGFSWWDVPISEVSSNPRVQAARREYEEKKKNQRTFGSGRAPQ